MFEGGGTADPEGALPRWVHLAGEAVGELPDGGTAPVAVIVVDAAVVGVTDQRATA